MPFYESFDEFRRRIGIDVPYFVVDRKYIFKNGAMSDGRYHADPPTDRTALLRVLVKYYAAKVEYGEDVFRKVQADIGTKGDYARLGAGGGPSEEDIRQLQEFQKYVVDSRADLHKYRTELRHLLGIDDRAAARDRQRELDNVTGLVQRAATIQI